MAAERLVGLVLIVLGVLLFVLWEAGIGGEAIPLLVGVGFLVAYAVTRAYGLLIPGGIITGLGSGIVVAAATDLDAAPVLGLGVGFLTIAVIDRAVRGRVTAQWWPLIPGSILTVIGVVALPGVRAVAGYLLPALLIAGGLWLIVDRGRLARRPPGAERVESRAGDEPHPAHDGQPRAGDEPHPAHDGQPRAGDEPHPAP